MNQQERKLVAATWTSLAAMYDRTLPAQAWTMLLDAVDDLPADAVLRELKRWQGGKDARRFPLAYDLRELIAPPVSDDTLAEVAVNRIVESVTRFGWNNGREAREYIGELGWEVVKKNGGWTQVCEGMNDRTVGVFRGQASRLATSLIELNRAGHLDLAPGFEAPKTVPAGEFAKLIGETGKRLESK